MAKKKILIRVDASSEIGYGHFIRMIALGQMFTDAGHVVHFATKSKNDFIERLLREDPFIIHTLKDDNFWDYLEDLKELLAIAKIIKPQWIVLDGYKFPTDYEKLLKHSGYKVLRVNDFSIEHCAADVLLDQNFGAENINHSVEQYTKVMSGLEYLLIRREFLKTPSKNEEFALSTDIHLLVCLGGSAVISDNLIIKVIKGLSNINRNDWSAVVITGKFGDKSKGKFLELASTSNLSINIIEQTTNMADELSMANLAILSGGSVMWEAMYMKVPFLGISLTRVQEDYLKLLSRNELCDDLGWHEDLTPQKISDKVLALAQDNARRERMIELADSKLNRKNHGIQLLRLMNNE